ncbi:MAG TPA: muconolactone Delta-isomerase family protein [Chloroflexota bacterium]|jgi:muconolactone delta-isomerase|nr:muconolactone Delta-isomerase family protein [Chloroflexota bacterium]
MQFLVTGEWVEHGALLPPEQAAQLLEATVLPSLQTLARWEDEGRLQGGILAGQRAGAYLLEAASAEEVGQLLASLPFWGMVRWSVQPLQSTRSAIQRDQEVAQQIRAHHGP